MDTEVREPKPQIHANRLLQEKSLYLLKHAHNPVDWYPWGQEAFDKARREKKPIFLSVGYSTCHWCDVMQRESFQSEAIGEIMNRHFVCIKLDREERPDVDKVYSTFLQETSSNVGWPMNVWMTPELRPYFGGNFFPLNDDGGGAIGFRTILMRIADQWEKKPIEFQNKSERIFANLQTVSYRDPASRVPPFLDVVIRCYQQLHNLYEEKYGGFSEVSKYPTPVYMRFLLTFGTFKRSRPEGVAALQMALHTLKTMTYGGIRDHVGLGFHRYSTDKSWHVPRFEKMLYDQAQLAVVYALAFQISGDELYAEVSKELLWYVSQELSDKSGGFYSAEDAYSFPTAQSSGKKEGAYYVWTAEEIQNLLPDPVSGGKAGITMADIFMFCYGVTEEGNTSQVKTLTRDLEGKNVLIQRHSLEMTAAIFDLALSDLKTILKTCKERLLQARKQRPKPLLDTKMLASWNGLMITAFAQCGMIFSKNEYIKQAENAATFLHNYMFDDYSGHLLRSCYIGGGNKVEQKSTPITGVLEDYAFVINALFDLYEATLDQQCLEWAFRLQETQDQLFWDSDNYGYFTSSDPSVILRVKDDHDGAQPNSNSISIGNLLRAAAYTRNPNYMVKAEKTFASFAGTLMKLPFTLPEMARALTVYYKTLKQVVITGKRDGKDTLELLKVVYTNYLPNKVLIYNDESRRGFLAEHLPFLGTLKKVDGRATAYVYEKFSWSKPITSPKDLLRLLTM